jgi:hypothetical protein
MARLAIPLDGGGCVLAWDWVSRRVAHLVTPRPGEPNAPQPSRLFAGLASSPCGRSLGNARRALIGMSDKGPSLDDHGTEIPPRRRPVLVTLPADRAGSSDPDDLATWPPQPLVGKPPRHCADLRLRPIPLLPEEEREESSIARNPIATRPCSEFLSHTAGSGGSSTENDPVVHRSSPGSPQNNRSGCGETSQDPSCSKAAATSRRRRSAPNGATTWTPIGRPSAVLPAGSEIAGHPVTVMTYAERIQSR